MAAAGRIARRVAAAVLGIIAAIVLVVIVAVLVVTVTEPGHALIRTLALRAVRGAGAIHGIVRIGDIDGDLLDHLAIRGLTITDSSGAPFLSVRQASLHYSILDLARKRLDFDHVVLDHPVVVLVESPDSVWNYKRIFVSSSQPTDTTARGFGSWIALTDVRVIDGDVTVRTPWRPDSSLRGPARDSAIRAALSPDSRLAVSITPEGGYQKTVAVHALSAAMPRLRLADPADHTKLVDVASLSAALAVFRPPEATVRDVTGTFYLGTDSLWWPRMTVDLPASRVSGRGRYSLGSGDMALALRADSLALADLRFVDPTLPSDGGIRADVGVTWRRGGKEQEYTVDRLALHTGGATATGEIGVTRSDTLAFHDTDLRVSGLDTRLIHQLQPTMHLPREGTIAGHARVAGGLHALTLDADVTFDDRSAGRSRVTATGEVGLGNGFEGRHLTVTLAPLQVALARAALPSLPLGGTITGRATVDGSTRDSMRAQADLVHQEDSAVTHLVAAGDVAFAPAPPAPAAPTDRPVRVRVVAAGAGDADSTASGTGAAGASRFRPERVNISAALEPADLGVLGRFMPAAKLHGRASGTIQVAGPMRDLAIHSRFIVVGAPDSSGLAIDGHADLASSVPGYDLRAAARRFDLRSVSAAGPPATVTATVTARGHGITPATMDATLAADIGASAIDSVSVDTVRLRATARGGELTVDTAHLRALATTADIAGNLGLVAGRTGTLTYRIAIDSLHAFRRFLPPDTSRITPRPQEVAAAIARARADSARRAASGDVLRALSDQPPPTLQVDTPRALRRDSLAGHALATGTIRGDLHAFDLSGQLLADSIVAMGSIARRGRILYHWSGGPSPASPIAATVELDTATDSGFDFDSLDARVTYRRPDGTLRIVVVEDPLRAYAINALYRFSPTEKRLSYDTLTFRFDTTVWRAPHPGAVDWSPAGLTVNRVELVNGRRGRIFVDGRLATRRDSAAHLTAQVRELDLATIASIAESDLPITGRLSLDADLRGSTEDPQLHGAMTVASALVRDTPLPNVFVSYAYDTATLVTHLELAPKGAPAAPFAVGDATVPINLSAGATGARLLDRPLRGLVRIDSLPLDAVPQFVSSVRDVAGRVHGRITLAGTTAHPAPHGTLAIDDGSATLVETGTALRDLVGRMHLTRDSVVIDSLVARTPSTGGRLRVAGSLDRSDPAVPVINATVRANDARVLSTKARGRVDVDADLTVAGPLTVPYIYGGTTVRSAVLYLAPASGKDIVDLSQPIVYHVADTTNAAVRRVISAPTSMLSRMIMDVDFTILQDSWVRNESGNVEAHTDGPLTVHIDRAQHAVVVNGAISTDLGEYSFLGKRFSISKGTATFAGTPNLNPSIQASGEYDVPVPGREAIAIQIQITGTIDSLRLALSSNAEPPIPQSDLLSYLAFSRPSSGLTQSTQSSSLTTATSGGGVISTASTFVANQLAGEAVSVLTSQLKGNLARALDADVLDITTTNNYVDISQQRNGAAAFIQNTALEFGKYFTPQTFVSLQASAAPGGRVIHRVGRELSLQLSGQPLYLLGQPTLATNTSTPLTGVFGLTLARSWRF